MIKILFLIHDLGQGGAEKVLVNLVNNMDRDKYDISVIALFGGGVNEQFLKPDINYRSIWPKTVPGNSKLMKLLSPKQLHGICVHEEYDIEVSYLEGPSARVISGCKNPQTKLVSWIHVEQHTMNKLSYAFRNAREAKRCYEKFDHTVCVSEFVKNDFKGILKFQKPCSVIYNTVESKEIQSMANESAEEILHDGKLNLIAVGSLKKSKGYHRMFDIIRRLVSKGYDIRLYVLGQGPLEDELKEYIVKNKLEENIILLGYKLNPYKYVAKCDLFICASYAEGFSTAVTESLLVGTPVCTVEVSGMKELLGQNNEYGLVTENSEKALYYGIKRIIKDQRLRKEYQKKALERSVIFETDATVKQVEELFESL